MEVNFSLSGLTPPQQRLANSRKRFTFSVWGRQSGKTTMGLARMVYRPIVGRPNGIYWFILQTHSAAEIAFNRYWDMTRNTGLLYGKPNESERFATLINGARVFFKSGENFEDLRAETLDGVSVDEYRQQHKDLWGKVIRPMLARHNGWADILTTPNGFDHSYDLYEAAKLDPEWETFHAPSTEAPWWTEEEIESARSTMSEDEFAQEIMAEFREMGVGKVYVNHGKHNQIETNPFAIALQTWSPHMPILVGADFNVGMMCWEIGQWRGKDIFYGDEIGMQNTNTEKASQVLAEKCIGHKAGVVIIGDASGKARKTSASETDYQIMLNVLRGKGIEVRNLTPESNPLVKDRVNYMNAALMDANGQPHFFYNPKKCPRLKKDLERVTWKQGTGDAVFDKDDPLLTHASDAAGYPVCHYSMEFKQRPGRLYVKMAR